MKRLLIVIWVIFAFQSTETYAQSTYPPPCTEVEQVDVATDTTKRRILHEFIRKGEGFNVEYDKGIVYLIQYTNEEGKKCWDLYARIDDSYRDNPPAQFMDFKGDIVLVYQGNEKGRPIKAAKSADVLNDCLEKIIGDRVFTRPKTRERWTSDLLPVINRPRREGNRRAATGGGGQIAIIFNGDGTYEKHTYY